MQTYDFVMLAVLLAATVFGAWKGLAWQIASLSSIFVSYLMAMRFRDPVAGLLTAEPPWNMFAAMLILYLGSSLAIWVAFRLVSGFLDQVRLKEFDRQIGALFGFAKGAVLCIVITLFAVALADEPRRERIVQSYSGYYIAVVLDRSDKLIPEELHGRLEPYLRPLDERLEPRPQSAWERWWKASDEPRNGTAESSGGWRSARQQGSGSPGSR